MAEQAPAPDSAPENPLGTPGPLNVERRSLNDIDSLINIEDDYTPPAEDLENPTLEDLTDEVEDEDYQTEDEEDVVEAADDQDVEEEEVAEPLSREDLLNTKVKLKVNGEEIEVTVDELANNYQAFEAAQAKFDQAARLRRQSEEFIKILKNPQTFWEAAKQLGHDVDKMAEDYIVERLKYEQMPEAERRALEAEKRLEALMREKETYEQQLKQQQQAELVKQYQGQLQKDIEEAITAIGLPKNKQTVAEVAEIMMRAYESEYRVTAQQAARLAKKRLQERLSGFLSESDEDTLERLVGDKKQKVVKARNKAAIKRKPTKKTLNDIPYSDAVKQKLKQEKGSVDWHDYWNNL